MHTYIHTLIQHIYIYIYKPSVYYIHHSQTNQKSKVAVVMVPYSPSMYGC